MEKAHTIGLQIIKCIKEDGKEDSLMDKECISAKMSTKALFQMG